MARVRGTGGHTHHHHHHGHLLARLTGWLRPHSHDLTQSIDATLERSAEGIRASKIGITLLAVTGAVQLVIALFSSSVALFADMLHNLADASTSIPLWIAFSLGARARTRRYGYGYNRSEDLAGLFIVVMLAVSAAVVGWESVVRLLSPRPMEHPGWVLLAGVVGVVGNELAAWVRIRTAKRIGSAALLADGFHARTDTMASFAVIVAAVATWVGVPILDPVLGIIICGLILWILKDTATQLFGRLMDGVDESVLHRLESLAEDVEGVQAVDWVRARWTGHRLLADLAIRVPGDLSVGDGHEIARRVKHALLDGMPAVEDAHVHVHPTTHAAAEGRSSMTA